MSRLGLLAPGARMSLARLAGLVIALICVVAPALPWGPLAASPPLPLAVMWAAYGWAAMGETGWRAPVVLFLLGLLQDQLSGGPLGLFAIIYLAGFLLGRTAATATRSANLFTEWAGFIATMIAVCALAALIAPPALGGAAKIGPFALAAGITALLFPLVRPLYIVGRAKA
ncbi:MAG: hypothetical protein ACOYM8_01735 [Caulobacterales bacterium]|jgi:rod shape-determining protein MreD